VTIGLYAQTIGLAKHFGVSPPLIMRWFGFIVQLRVLARLVPGATVVPTKNGVGWNVSETDRQALRIDDLSEIAVALVLLIVDSPGRGPGLRSQQFRGRRLHERLGGTIVNRDGSSVQVLGVLGQAGGVESSKIVHQGRPSGFNLALSKISSGGYLFSPGAHQSGTRSFFLPKVFRDFLCSGSKPTSPSLNSPVNMHLP
jgi:hypothetical protein